MQNGAGGKAQRTRRRGQQAQAVQKWNCTAGQRAGPAQTRLIKLYTNARAGPHRPPDHACGFDVLDVGIHEVCLELAWKKERQGGRQAGQHSKEAGSN